MVTDTTKIGTVENKCPDVCQKKKKQYNMKLVINVHVFIKIVKASVQTLAVRAYVKPTRIPT